MASLREFAQAYEPPQVKNIADLKEVSTEIQVEGRTGKDNDGKEFKYQVVVIGEEEYRVPSSVISSLKEVLKKKPTLKRFSVSKTGAGMNTKYTLIPLE